MQNKGGTMRTVANIKAFRNTVMQRLLIHSMKFYTIVTEVIRFSGSWKIVLPTH